MNKKDFKRVGLFGSDYALLIYLLYSTKEEIDDTFFVFNQGIPEKVREYFCRQSYDLAKLPGKKGLLREAADILNHLTYRFRWPFMKNAEFWGMPIVGVEFLGSRKIHQIEEGGEHLGLSANNPRKWLWLRRLLHGEWFENYTLDSPQIASIVLTHPLLKHKTHKNCKQIIIDLAERWRNNVYGRQILLDSHGITKELLQQLSDCKYLLLTQTFTEDGVLPLEREIELYRQLLGDVNLNELLIKPHPREYINKASYFPGAKVFSVKCPMQLLAYCGFQPQKIYTINSTSLYSLPYKNIKMEFMGTECDDRLVKRFGIMKAREF